MKTLIIPFVTATHRWPLEEVRQTSQIGGLTRRRQILPC